MSFTYTPIDTFECPEKEWAPQLGMLDWDLTKIVFTKRELMEFLKYTGTSVDPNFQNIQKLPRYAKFGKFSSGEAGPIGSGKEEDSAVDGSKPSRRVREPPGGTQSSRIFGEEFQDDALSQAPPKDSDPPTSDVQGSQGFKPTRRVRTGPGGPSTLGSLFSGEDEEPTKFVPTRRVRQGPGGQDNLDFI